MREKPRKSYGISPEPPDVTPNGRYTNGEAAKKLRLHRNTISNLFKAGVLKAIDPTAEKVRFSGKELRRFWYWKTACG